MSKSVPQYWSRLGSSKSRTKDQVELSKEIVGQIVNESPESSIIAFTDGSCLGNPGPCGAGAAIFPGDHEPVNLKRPVAHRGSILLGELVAILMVLEYCLSNVLKSAFTDLKILSDSQSAVGIVSHDWKSSNYTDLIMDIKEHIATLLKNGIQTTVAWTPGHADIAGNEQADKLAKEAAQEATTLNASSNIITINDVKQAAQENIKLKWQRRWDLSNQGRHLHTITPGVGSNRCSDKPSKEIAIIISELRTGYSRLNKYRYNLGHCESPLCTCGQEETTEHLLLVCPLYDSQREYMCLQLRQQLGIFQLTSEELLATNKPAAELDKIREILGNFIRDCGRFQFLGGPISES